MEKTNWRPSALFLALLTTAFAATHAPARAQESWPRYEQDYARPRDLVALHDDLNQLDLSLAALPRRHPRAEEFRRRTAEIRRDVSSLAERIRQDRREGRFDTRYNEERYGADRRYVPTRLSYVTLLRSRIANLRDDVEFAQRRRVGNTDFVVPAGTEIEVMLDSGLSSRWSNVEDPVEASTIAAVRRNDRTLIPAGATVTGYVREVRSRRRGQQDGLLRLEFDALIPEGGPRMDLRSQVVGVSETRSEDRRLRNGALGALLGGVIGGIVEGKKGALIGAAVGAGGGLLATKGQDLDLPEGTLLVLRLDEPLRLPRRDNLISRRY
jgi:hypothetical protein